MKQRVPGSGIGSEFGLGELGGYRFCWKHQSCEKYFEKVSFVANGRATLVLALRYARETGKQRNTVLLPAYLCHSMVQPFLQLGLKVNFYPVDRHLTIQSPEISNRINNQTLAVVFLHYFGFEQPQASAASLAEQFPDVIFIDDRTHSLLSDLHARTTFSPRVVTIYSPRKWGPFPDLGLILWPRQHTSDPGLNCGLDNGYDLSFSLWRLAGIFMRTLYFIWPIKMLGQTSLQLMHRGEAILNKRVLARSASPLSRFLWQFWDWQIAWQMRRKNYRYLLDHWTVKDAVPLFKDLPESVCPLGFPVRSANRDELKDRLISHGIFPPIHWPSPAQVPVHEFSEAAILANQELTIPIDQRYDLKHMDYILGALCHA